MKETWKSRNAKQGARPTRAICSTLQDASGVALYDDLPGCQSGFKFQVTSLRPPASKTTLCVGLDRGRMPGVLGRQDARATLAGKMPALLWQARCLGYSGQARCLRYWLVIA